MCLLGSDMAINITLDIKHHREYLYLGPENGLFLYRYIEFPARDGCVRCQSAPNCVLSTTPTASLTLEEIKDFEPELVINAATVKYTLDAFRQVLPVLPKDCIISDIASVKTGLKKFYEESGFRYVSTHPMLVPLLPASTI